MAEQSLAELYPHYHKSVKGFDSIDVYRVLMLWQVNDPAVQHAVKKLLCLGDRGSKDFDKDLKESIHTLQRLQDIRKEDAIREASAGLAIEQRNEASPMRAPVAMGATCKSCVTPSSCLTLQTCQRPKVAGLESR